MTTPEAHATRLILVCCHAIYLSGPTRGQSEEEWLLATFQKGETPAFTEHITTGLSLLSSEPSSLLIFSGSKTRKETGKSEARSYWDLCHDNDFWDTPGSKRHERVLLEEQALDSFGVLIFSILKFWKVAGRWPKMITIISHEFKRARFLDLHVKAARWPRGKVEFVGVDPKYMVRESAEWDERRAEAVWRGEKENGITAWEIDLQGAGETLRGKRIVRNCWNVSQAWFESEVERTRSGVKSRIVSVDSGVVEEILSDEKQPWEDKN